MKLLTAAQMRELERRANDSGNTYADMMERAGTLTAQAIMQHWQVTGKRVLVLVGPGNNGGDGLVCARVLHDAGAKVLLYVWRRTPDEDDVNWNLSQERGIPSVRAEEDVNFNRLNTELPQTDVLVDALLGTGVARPIGGLLQELLQEIQKFLNRPRPQRALLAPSAPEAAPRARPIIVAVDLPTGLNPDTGALDPSAIPADLTVTFAFPKVGHYRFPGADVVGELVVADIGIPQDWAVSIPLAVASADEIRALLPKRERNSNKGTYGKAMIACGSLQFTGAPTMAAHAAGRAGAGLVTIGLPQTIHPIVAAKINEATFLPLPDRLGDWRPRSANELLAFLWDSAYDALLVGCGLGRAESTREFLLRLLENMPTLQNPPALVIDADGLNLLADVPEWWTRMQFSPPPILTPHPGEMARLLKMKTSDVQDKRIELAHASAKNWGVVVVLKGAFTVIAAPNGETTLLPFANPALATAGTGDVLAGTIAGLLAQSRAASRHFSPNDSTDPLQEAYHAALVGAYVHGLAGDLAAQSIGHAGVVAGDLLPHLPEAIRLVQK